MYNLSRWVDHYSVQRCVAVLPLPSKLLVLAHGPSRKCEVAGIPRYIWQSAVILTPLTKFDIIL